MRMKNILSFYLVLAFAWSFYPHSTIAGPPDSWHLRYSSSEILTAVAYGNGIFAAVGDQGTILHSADGITRGQSTSGSTMNFNRETYGEGTFVAVGRAILRSDPVVEKTISTLDTPVGPAGGVKSHHETYSTEGSSSNFDHSIEYQFDWKGDGSELTAWGSPAQSKTYNVVGAYDVRDVDNFSQSDVQNLVIDYYNDILNRAPEAGGAEWWTAEIERVVSLGIDVNEGFIAMGKFFFNSTEYLSMGKTDTAFVTDLYQTFLNRAPSQGEIDFWLGSIAGGASRNIVLNNFIFSPEFKTYMEGIFGVSTTRPENNLVNDFYRGFLSRLPENEGFDYWLDLMITAQCSGLQAVKDLSHQIALGFIESSEYAAKGRTSIGYVEDLYDGILRRTASPADINYWVGVLDGGASREKVLQGFTDSTEFQERVDQVTSAGCPGTCVNPLDQIAPKSGVYYGRDDIRYAAGVYTYCLPAGTLYPGQTLKYLKVTTASLDNVGDIDIKLTAPDGSTTWSSASNTTSDEVITVSTMAGQSKYIYTGNYNGNWTLEVTAKKSSRVSLWWFAY